MELIADNAYERDEWNFGTEEQLKGWITDNTDAIKAMHTLMTVHRNYPEGCEDAWYHTWANFEPYGGNEGAIICLREIGTGQLELVVTDEEGDEYSETLDVK